MTNKGGNYDPFSYGEVRLAAGTSEKPQAADAPEDLLFAAAPNKNHHSDPGWEPVPAQMDLLGGPIGGGFGAPAGRPAGGAGAGMTDFGAEILSAEKARAGGQPMPVVRPRPAPLSGRQEDPATVQQQFGMPAPGHAMSTIGNMPEPASRQAPIVKEKIIGALPAQRLQVHRQPGGSLVLPGIVFVAGAAAGGWFWLVQHNAILGGFAAAIGVVGAAFAWIHVRR